MSIRDDDAGFTLIEVIVAMALSMVVLAATLGAFAGFARSNRAVSVKNDAQQDVRAGTDQLARELRNAVSSRVPTPTSTPVPIELNGEFDLMFQTVARTGAGSANKLNVKRVRYCLDTSTPSRERLYKQTQRWMDTDPPLAPSIVSCPDPAWDSWDSGKPAELVADRLVNGLSQPAFKFAYSPGSPGALTDVTGIQTSLFVNREPASPRNTAELTSAVRLRNTNRSPTAAFSVTQQNGHVLFNATASVDPEGDTLKYEWTRGTDPTVIGTNARLDYQGSLTSGSSYTFTLKVTDSGGLSNPRSQTVTIQ